MPVENKLVNTAHLSMLLRYNNSIESKNYADKALSLMKETTDNASKAEAWSYLYFVYRTLTPDLKHQAIDSVLYYGEKSNNDRLIGIAYYLQGHEIDSTDFQIPVYFKALDYLQKANAYKEIARTCYDLAGTFALMNVSINQKIYAQMAMQNAVLSKNPDALCIAYLAMSTSYSNFYAKDTSKRQYLDSSITLLQQCLATFRSNEQSCETRFVPETAAINLADLYYRYYPRNLIKDTAESLIHYAREWAEKANDMLAVFNAWGLLSQWALEAGDYDNAEKFTKTALTTLWSIDRSKYSTQTYCYAAFSVYNELAHLAELRGDYKQALECTKKQMCYQDTLLNAKTIEKINNTENNFTKQKILQENAFNKKAFYLSLGIGILAFLSLVSFVMLYRNRLKQSNQHKKLLEIEALNNKNEKDKAVLIANLEKERSERLATEQTLTQQKNESLQKKVMASTLQIIQKDELLQEVKDKLQTQATDNISIFKEISRSIENHKALDKDLSYYKDKIAGIHPVFFSRLQEKANNKLTDIDLKYAVYILMGISTKNMASIMRVELTSIRMAKYRIKQKLGLAKEEELDNFIKNIV